MRNFLLIGLFWLLSSSIIKGEPQNYTFVLVHGAWHGDWVYYQIETLLENSGHKVICVNLPGHGIDKTDPGQVTLDDYQNAVTDVLDTISEQVILVAHSMGGIAISMVAEARPKKISKLVYLAAFMIESGQSMLEMSMKDTASLIGPNLLFDFDNDVVDVNRENLRELFYNQTSTAKIKLAKKLLTLEPLRPVMTELYLTDENYGSIPRFYISTLNDNTITPYFQYKMYRDLPFRNIYYIYSDHAPFLSAPLQLKHILLNIARTSNRDDIFLKSIADDNISDVQNEIKIYIDDMKQLCIESTEHILYSNIKLYSLSGRLLAAFDSTPESFREKYSLSNVYENFIIVVANINGETITRKLLL